MSEENHKAIVKISYEFLRDLLFPEGTKIRAIMADPQDIFGRGDFVCVIENLDLPIHQPGELLITVTPTYRRNYSGNENEIATVEFVDWGIGK